MEYVAFSVSSVTNAMRGKTILQKAGYTAYIGRSTENTTGCGYTLTVKLLPQNRGGEQRAEQLLRDAGIVVRDKRRGEQEK